jgi:hypothetical protein
MIQEAEANLTARNTSLAELTSKLGALETERLNLVHHVEDLQHKIELNEVASREKEGLMLENQRLSEELRDTQIDLDNITQVSSQYLAWLLSCIHLLIGSRGAQDIFQESCPITRLGHTSYHRGKST